MAYVSRRFECLTEGCGASWDDLVLRKEENEQRCPSCGGPAPWVISGGYNIASYSLLDKQGQAEVLRKRSREHTLRMAKKDPESLGKKTVHKLSK